MKADPPWANIYLRFRDEDYGRVPIPGLEVETPGRGVRIYDSINHALTYIRNLHDRNLKGTK